MRTLFRPAALLLLSWSALSAASIYRIDFSGTITDGTLLVTSRTQLQSFPVPFSPGGAVRGSLFANLGAAPAPLLDGSGIHWFAPLSARLEVTLPALPADVLLPIPSTFVIQESWGTKIRLQFATIPQVVFPQFTFSEPPPPGRNYKNEGNMFAFLGPGPGIVLPDGVLSPSFAATNLSGNGGFRVLKIDQDIINQPPPLFGLTEFYDLSVSFTATEARGGFVPEPGTAGLVLLSLPLVLLALRARRRR